MKKNEDKVLTERVFIQTIQELRGIFASKDDLKQFATKEDLKQFATKEDLRNELKAYATKEDLRNELKAYATKEDLEGVRDSLLDAIENTDRFARKRIENHEKRITTLESTKN